MSGEEGLWIRLTDEEAEEFVEVLTKVFDEADPSIKPKIERSIQEIKRGKRRFFLPLGLLEAMTREK